MRITFPPSCSLSPNESTHGALVGGGETSWKVKKGKSAFPGRVLGAGISPPPPRPAPARTSVSADVTVAGQ